MEWIDVEYKDPKLGVIGTSKLPNVPNGWWVLGVRQNEVQSRAKPCFLSLVASSEKKFGCVSMFFDSGEAFSYFERGKNPMSAQSNPLAGMMGGFFGMPFMAMPQLPVPEMPLPDHGRPIRYFSSIGDYLDNCVIEYMQAKDTDCELKLIREELVGKVDAVNANEQRLTTNYQNEFSKLNGTFTYKVNKCLDRVIMRTYDFIDKEKRAWRVVLGAGMSGHDMLAYHGQHQGRLDVPFGRCSVDGAIFYEVEWKADYRFGGCCPIDHEWAEFLSPWCKYFSTTAKFSKAQCDYMQSLTDKMSKEAHERHERDLEGLRRLNAEMHEENRRRQERLDWERRRSWERKQASDRRIREGWSAAIRGVEQYRGPYGELIEVPVAGPGYHAYYDRLNGTIIHTDRYMGDRLEELPEWRW